MSDVYGGGWPQSADLGSMAMQPQQPMAPTGNPMNIVPGAAAAQPTRPGAAPGGLSPQLLAMIAKMGQLPFPVPQGAGAAPTPGPSPMFRALMPSAYNMPGGGG
jgi:hypothetical protein